MKPGTGFTSGRPTNPAAGVKAVMRYLPTIRRPWLPHRFTIRNLTESDAQRMWSVGRRQESPASPYSGYSTVKTFKKHDETSNMIPVTELSRFMPNIHLGSKALVTPVTLMSARDGQRVTHDLIHSYDPYIGNNSPGPKAPIDHDNISVLDPNRVGLHGGVMSCRANIYRWMRRPPFHNEMAYFNQTALKDNGRKIVESEAEKPLVRKIIRLAQSGQLKLACEEYRRLTVIPPLDVYRALLAACVPHGLIGDAVSIYTEGNILKGMTRDYECLRSLMRTAIAADHPERVMWVFTQVRGEWSTNVLKRTRIETLHAAQLYNIALEYYLDHGYEEFARAIYRCILENGLQNMDLYELVGLRLREEMERGAVANIPENLDSVMTQVDVGRIAAHVAQVWMSRWGPHDASALGNGTLPPSLSALETAYSDVDVQFVMRTARFLGEQDLLSGNQHARYTDRVLAWLELLSDFHRRVSKPLPYLRKTKASLATSTIRVASDPRAARHVVGAKLPSEDGFGFWYDSSRATRAVQESYPSLHDGVAARRLLVRDPVQYEVGVDILNLADDHRPTEVTRAPTSIIPHKSISVTRSFAPAVAGNRGDAGGSDGANANKNLSVQGMSFN